MTELYINRRIQNNYKSFMVGNKKFVDTILQFVGQESIPCHKIILSKESTWFKNYYSAHTSSINEVLEVQVPVNPENIFPEIINFFYFSKLNITIKNIAPLYFCSVFYGIEKLLFIMKMHLARALNKKTALFLCSDLVKYKLDEAASTVAPIFAEELHHILMKEPALFMKNDIFRSSSPKVIAAMLKDPQLDDISVSEKVELIDEYIGQKVISEDEKESLASVIDWTIPSAHNILVSNVCDWVPARISRSLYSKALDARRRTLVAFSKEAEEAPKYLGLWFPLSWLTSVVKADACDETPIVDAVEFMSTFGIFRSRFDPRKYTLLDATGTKALSSDFAPGNVLTKESYFVSVTKEGELPYFELDFGIHAGVKTLSLDISCEAANASGTPKEVPQKLNIAGYVQGSDEAIYDHEFSYAKAKLDENGFKQVKLECHVPIRKIKISLQKDSEFGFNVLRISKIRVNCAFIAA